MLKINMFSSATKVAGQGVGSAYLELINLLKKFFPKEFDVRINRWNSSQISHYHTVDFKFFLSTFSPGRGRKIGYVHFLPKTMEGSLNIPQPFRAIFYWYLVGFYKRMDHLVVVNPSFISKLEELGIDRGKISYIPNFVRKDEFYEYSTKHKLAMREKLGFAQDQFVVLGIGQIQERKGIADFIELAQKNPDIQFIWGGGFSFGRITDGYEKLKKVVDAPPANLHFPGIVKRTELVDYYNIADLFLLPSYDELFPMSVLEAFSCGTPVLLRDLDLYHSIIDGYYESAQNLDEFDEKIHMFRNNKAGWQLMHDKALIASTRYSEANLAKIWHHFYIQQAKKED